MGDMIGLIAATIAFVGGHFVLSHPLRAPMVARLGENAFLGVYSIFALAALGWMILAYRAAPSGEALWAANEAIWIVATLLMWIAAIFWAGSLVGNPALPNPAAKKAAIKEPAGVFRITRHPMMWSFAIWGFVHLLIAPRADNLVLCGGIIILALVGSRLQERKKFVAMGDAWVQWQSRTNFIPFARGFAFPGWMAVIVGTVAWLALSWLHMPLAGMPAGIFFWL
ncbi:MAG: NnrU family protein [Blastomonas sp.]